MSDQTWTGQCLCGALRFAVTGEPDYPHTCSCLHCQKLSGGPMMAWVSFPRDDLEWTGLGEPTWYYTFQNETRRGFCLLCGSQVCAEDDNGTTIAFTLSALDRGGELVPVNQSFRHDAVSWLPQVPDTRPPQPAAYPAGVVPGLVQDVTYAEAAPASRLSPEAEELITRWAKANGYC